MLRERVLEVYTWLKHQNWKVSDAILHDYADDYLVNNYIIVQRKTVALDVTETIGIPCARNLYDLLLGEQWQCVVKKDKTVLKTNSMLIARQHYNLQIKDE